MFVCAFCLDWGLTNCSKPCMICGNVNFVMEKHDWEKIYGLYGGKMTGCAGVECPLSCCAEKRGVDEFFKEFTFNTVLGDGELEHLQSVVDLKSLGIEIKEVSAVVKGAVREMVVLSGCVGDDGCKLADSDRKPLACRSFPLKFSTRTPVDNKCPSLSRILRDDDVIASVFMIREMLGYTDSEQWLKNVTAVRANVSGEYSPIRLEPSLKLNS